MFSVSAFLLVISCCLALNKKNDPNYSEEFRQVYDAKLSASIIVSCGIRSDRVALSRLKPVALTVLGAFRTLNFQSVIFFVCDDIYDTFQSQTGLEAALLNKISEATGSMCDVLVLLDSLPSKDGRETSKFADSSSSSRFSANHSMEKLRIFCNLNIQHMKSAVLDTIYDMVLLSSKSEKHMLSRSWTAAVAQRSTPSPTITILGASAIAIQHDITEIYTSRGIGDILRRSDSITVFLQNILSSTFSTGSDTAPILHSLDVLSMKKDGPLIRHVYWLYTLSSSQSLTENNAIDVNKKKILLELTDVLDRFSLKTNISFTITQYNPIEMYANTTAYSNGLNAGSMHYSDALRLSPVAWVLLPHHMDFNDVYTIITAEEFFIKAGACGCISVIIGPQFMHSDASSPGVRVPSVSKYQYLVDDVSVFTAGSITELVSVTELKGFSSLLKTQNILTAKGIRESQKDDVSHLSELILRGVIGSTFKLFTEKSENIGKLRNLTANFSLLLPSYEHPSSSYITNLKTVFNGIGNTVRNREKSTKYSALIIEARIDGSFEFCVRNVMYHLGPSWGLLVFHSTGKLGNEEYVKRSLKDISGVQYIAADSVYDGDSYNRLLRSAAFWKNLSNMGLEKVFIFQTDSLLLKKDGITDFLGWDYIGAPWHMVKEADSGHWLRKIQNGGALRSGVGNGGTSLRSVAVMVEIAENYRLNGEKGFNEDTFFAHFCEKHYAEKQRRQHAGGCLLATREAAYSFAVEIPPPFFLTNKTSLEIRESVKSNANSSLIPFALHNTWAYISPALTLELLQLSILEK
jgi:Protein of unknown function (DUF5672)